MLEVQIFIEYKILEADGWWTYKKYFFDLEEARKELISIRKRDSDAILYYTCTDKNSPFYGVLIWDW